jgi:hypothetical protein
MCESVKALLAVQVTLLMLFGCVARPPTATPYNAATAANSTPAAATANSTPAATTADSRPAATTTNSMPVVTTANTTSAATTPARSASANSSTDNANPAVNQALVKRGFQPRRLNGQLKYCRSQVLTGTHFRSTVCLTPDEISAADGNTKSDLNQLDRPGRSICPNNNCGIDQ